ncbi:MAG: hypothetical protein ACREQL_04980 [Candidatus Binatia bacterium]
MSKRIVLAFAIVSLSFGLASAQTTTAECRIQAKNDYLVCKLGCREANQSDKDNCRNCEHTFAEGCRASRAICVDPFEEILEGCLEVCRADLATAKGLCVPGDPLAYDACIDAAQLAAFSCRDLCREDTVVRDGIKNCRLIFRGCMHLCPPAS